MNLYLDVFLVFAVLGILFWQTFTITKKKPENLIKKKRFFTKKGDMKGIYYEEDENGNITIHKNGE